ncbi:MAG: hypothetical protein QXF74_05755 [Nitrososphaerota archaeon]
MIQVEESGLSIVFEVLSERKTSAIISELVGALTQSVEDIVKDITPVRSGRLRSAIRSEWLSTYEQRVVIGDADVRYAPFVFYGTRPHIIEPTSARALRFKVDGRTFFARRTFHPGTKPIPLWTYMVDSVRVVLPEIAQRVLNKM